MFCRPPSSEKVTKTTNDDQGEVVTTAENNGVETVQEEIKSTKKNTRIPPPGSAERKQGSPQKAREEWGLPSLRVVDQDGKVITVNPEKPTPIESEYFKGVILIMLKCDGEYSEYNRYADHFGKKQRKFEVQFQV